MSETYNIYEAKTHLSSLLERVAKGEQIIIAKAGKPLGKLVPLNYAPKGFGEEGGQAPFTHQGLSGKRHPERKPGRLKGKVWIAPDAFSPEVDAEIAAMFEQSEIFPPETTSGRQNPKRVFDLAKGRIWIADNFDDPMPEFEKAFYNSEIEPSEK